MIEDVPLPESLECESSPGQGEEGLLIAPVSMVTTNNSEAQLAESVDAQVAEEQPESIQVRDRKLGEPVGHGAVSGDIKHCGRDHWQLRRGGRRGRNRCQNRSVTR